MFSPPPSRNGYHTSKSTPRCPLLKLNSSPAKELRLHSTDSYTQGRTAEASAHGNLHPLAMSSFCRRTLAGPFGRKEWQSRGEEGTSRSVFFSCTNVPFLSLRHCHVNRKKIPVPILMQEPVERAQGTSQGTDALLRGRGGTGADSAKGEETRNESQWCMARTAPAETCSLCTVGEMWRVLRNDTWTFSYMRLLWVSFSREESV